MKDGLIVVSSVVAGLVLWETILPWTFAALRHRWRKAKAAKSRIATGETTVRADAPTERAGVPIDSQPALDVTSLESGYKEAGTSAGLQESCATTDRDLSTPPDTPVAPTIHDQQSAPDSAEQMAAYIQDEAERLWTEARQMKHRFNPDMEKDHDYLSKIYGAASMGHLAAMVKLGEYASRRRAVVEAYYWTALAELKGAKGLEKTLREMLFRWKSLGCPTEHQNVYDGFSRQQGSFARALLRIRSAVDLRRARARMRELADQGCEEAVLFLAKSKNSTRPRPAPVPLSRPVRS